MGRPRKNPDDPKWAIADIKQAAAEYDAVFADDPPLAGGIVLKSGLSEKVPAKRGRPRITFRGEPISGADASTYVGRMTNFFWKLWQDTAHSHPEYEAMKEQFTFWVKVAKARGLKVAGDDVVT